MSDTQDPGTRPPPLVVVGASAGGVEALRDFVAGLPRDFPACVLVVLHVPADAPSALPTILKRAGRLPARHAVDGDILRPGEILVAPPDRHLMVLDGAAAVTHGPQENGHRPAVDVLFRSAARTAGQRALGVVLSGSLDDGAAGALAIARRGGRIIVQDFEEALYPSMPRAAAAAAAIGVGVRAHAIGGLLTSWLEDLSDPQDPAGRSGVSVTLLETMEREVLMADLDPETMHEVDRPGRPAGFGCPDCGGALYQIDDSGLRRFRCRVGHAWSPESLLARQTVAMESALWMALRSLQEKAALNTELAERASEHHQERTATRFTQNAEEALRAAELVRQLIDDLGSRGDAQAGESEAG